MDDFTTEEYLIICNCVRERIERMKHANDEADHEVFNQALIGKYQKIVERLLRKKDHSLIQE